MDPVTDRGSSSRLGHPLGLGQLGAGPGEGELDRLLIADVPLDHDVVDDRAVRSAYARDRRLLRVEVAVPAPVDGLPAPGATVSERVPHVPVEGGRLAAALEDLGFRPIVSPLA